MEIFSACLRPNKAGAILVKSSICNSLIFQPNFSGTATVHFYPVLKELLSTDKILDYISTEVNIYLLF